jgi:glucose-1-phosphate cytidylyltransferase
LTDLDLNGYVDTFLAQPDKTAGFLAVHSTQSFHVANVTQIGEVTSIDPLSESDLWINGGYFIFRNEIFRHLHQGEDLVFEPFQRLIAERKLWAHRYRGFWTAMDTFKDRQALEERYEAGIAPWEVWKQPSLELV